MKCFKYWYEGNLNPRKDHGIAVNKAITAYRAQKIRCYTKASKQFKYYGGKGICIEYSLREFVAWYLENFPKKLWKDPVIGRIDHSKNYSFDNIEIVERSENSKECMDRVGRPRIFSRKVIAYKNGHQFATFFSMLSAAKFFGKTSSCITEICQGIHAQTKEGLSFRYFGVTDDKTRN